MRSATTTTPKRKRNNTTSSTDGTYHVDDPPIGSVFALTAVIMIGNSQRLVDQSVLRKRRVHPRLVLLFYERKTLEDVAYSTAELPNGNIIFCG